MDASIPEIATNTLRVGSGSVLLAEKELVEGLATSDKRILETLYTMYCGSLFGIINRIVKEEEIAEDVLQETFIRIWKSFSLYDPAKGRLFTWMANLARNLALDKLKSKSYRNNKLNEKISDLQITVDNQFYIKNNTETIGLRDMVMRLKPEYQSIVELIYFRGYTHTEAAEELNIPLGTIKTRLRMAINDLRKYFN